MTFSLSVMAREITAAVNLCAQIVDASGKIPILRATRIDASARTLMATNSEQTISVKIACEGEGVACIDTPALLAKVSTLKPDAPVEFKGDGKSVTISQGRTRWTAPCLLDDFPTALAKPIDGKPVKLSAAYIGAIAEVHGVLDASQVHRPEMTGVRLQEDKIIATDGRTLRRITGTEKLKKAVILPGRIAPKLPALFADGAGYRATETTISLSSDTVTLFTRLVDGQYPDIERVIATFTLPNTATVKTADLIASLKRAGAINNSGEKSVSFLNMRLTFSGSEIEVFCRNLDGEEGADYCAAQCSADVAIGFNGRQLIEEIDSLPSDTLTITYNDSRSPICISAGESKRYVQARDFR